MDPGKLGKLLKTGLSTECFSTILKVRLPGPVQCPASAIPLLQNVSLTATHHHQCASLLSVCVVLKVFEVNMLPAQATYVVDFLRHLATVSRFSVLVRVESNLCVVFVCLSLVQSSSSTAVGGAGIQTMMMADGDKNRMQRIWEIVDDTTFGAHPTAELRELYA